MSGNPWYQLRASSLTFLGPTITRRERHENV